MSSSRSEMSNLERVAASIPSMNTPFAKTLLRGFARSSPDGTAIVEVGTWLGSGTAHLALGVSERERPVPIHSYDRFQADRSEAKKAASWGLDIEPSSDTQPVVETLLQDFPAEIHLRKGDLFGIRWDNGPIGLYVDDAAKRPSAFYQMLEVFAPFWVRGQTIICFRISITGGSFPRHAVAGATAYSATSWSGMLSVSRNSGTTNSKKCPSPCSATRKRFR